MSIEFPFFAFFSEEPKKRKPDKTEEAEVSADTETADQAPREVSTASASTAPSARFEPKPFRVKGGSKRRRRRKTGP